MSFCQTFQDSVTKYPARIALRNSEGTMVITYAEYGKRVRQIAAGLHARGVRRGDTVALMLTNRPEFHLVDTAVLHLGAVPFSVYNTSSVEQIAFLFNNAGNRVVMCEEQFLPTITEAVSDSSVEHILKVEELADLEQSDGDDFDFEATWRAVEPDDLMTIIYTSGTTGPPKGVELTHANVAFSIESALMVPEISRAAEGTRALSYLPDAHLANRWLAHYVPVATGMTVTTLADAKQLAPTIAALRPTMLLGVPTVWYKFKAGLEAAVAAEEGPKAKLINWALDVGSQQAEALIAGRSMPPLLKAQHAIADKLVLSKLRERLGLDQMLLAVSGAAPVSPDALRFFISLGLPMAEGWGMSESCLVGTLTPLDRPRPGTVGKPFPGVDVKIADDGELLVKSAGVMRGYRNSPEQTAEAIDADGWLHTGDIATIDQDGYVAIVDRKKELIINAAGKNMSPTNIESAIQVECGLIGSVIAIGDQRPYVTALVCLDPEASAGVDDDAALAQVEAAVGRANGTLSRVEQVKKFKIVANAWDAGGDELTPTMKLKRKPIAAKYADVIEELYATDDRKR
jgi:long-chain acyl-CoA synthetase